MSAMRDALRAAGLPIDPRQSEHFQEFWLIPEPEPITHKLCGACLRTLPLDAFHLTSEGVGGRHTYCKSCRSTRRKETAA